MILVNTNPLYTASDMAHQFKDSGAEALVIVDMFADKLEDILVHTGIRQVIVAEVPQGFSVVPRAVIRGVMRWWNRTLPPVRVDHVRLGQALAEGAAARRDAGADLASFVQGVNNDTLALLQYTGGTTGVSKGAMLSHGNLLHNIDQAFAMGASHI